MVVSDTLPDDLCRFNIVVLAFWVALSLITALSQCTQLHALRSVRQRENWNWEKTISGCPAISKTNFEINSEVVSA
jgi:hypothetical protein